MSLPLLDGLPIRVELRKSLGPHLAATSIPNRKIALDRQVLESRGDFERVLIHEIFHFAWARLGNPIRRAWERILEAEVRAGSAGELGWSAEWRRAKLKTADFRLRSPRWRRYVCESFCDTAAWLYAGLDRHPEFTLSARARQRRKSWFLRNFSDRPVYI